MNNQEFIQELNTTFKGNPWHGNSLLKQIEDINPEIALFRPTPDNHNIIEIIKHVLLWREFVIEKLKGNEEFDLKFGSPEEWPVINDCSNRDLQQMVEELTQSQLKLTSALDKLETGLSESVVGKRYTFSFMISGIIYHDVYHSGQIGLIKSIFKRQHAR